jgi:hypothetical protein
MISTTFTGKEAKKASEQHKADLLKRQTRAFKQISVEADINVMSIDDIHAAIERNLTKHLYTCSKCGKVMSSYSKVLNHMGNPTCRKRVAELNGLTYTPPGMVRFTCKFCKEEVQKCNWKRHEISVKHKRNLRIALGKKCKSCKVYCCELCEKKFTGKRGKRDLTRHLTSKKHQKAVVLKV